MAGSPRVDVSCDSASESESESRYRSEPDDESGCTYGEAMSRGGVGEGRSGNNLQTTGPSHAIILLPGLAVLLLA